jgi:hypothetical protein
MGSESKRPGSIAPLLAGSFLLAVLAVSFVPFFECRTCAGERHNFEDWLTDPVVREYREKHPEEVADVKAQLRRIDENCRRCSSGKVTVWARMNLQSR